MADNIGSLYVRLGLSLSELETGFVTAEQTVRQGIATLNRQQNIVKLKMEADTAGLDAIADKSKILAIQEQALTQVLEMQRDKLKLATAAYQDLANSKNANSAAVQNSQAAMERERLAIARLEAQLKSLSGQKLFIDTTQLQESIAKINAKIQHIRITAEIDTSKLKSAGSVFDEQKAHVNALTKELELQRQKLIQLREAMYQSAKATGGGSVQTLNIKSNVLQQIQEINRLETKLKEIQNTNINLQIRADSIKKAEADIQENISRINAKIEHVRVKTDIDVSKLGTVATEFDRAKAHVQGLNQELTLQNQKLAEMRKALSTSISANGLNNVKTITLSTEIQKQIQAIDQLKAKINELNKIQPPQTNNLLSNYLNIKGDVVGKLNEITSAFSQLKGATSSADSAITSTLGVIGTIPHPVGRAVAALASLPLVFKGVENSIISMTRAAAEAGDATYVMSRGMQMSLKDAGKFSTNAKVAGTEVNSLKMAIQQVQRQIVKGGDDSRAAEWLKRYGESARDANGNLKNLNDMTFALSRALHKAQEEGKGAEFVFSVFRNISADDITAIEDWIAVNEQAATIVKNGLANPALAHEVKGNLNALAVQEGQLKASFESALLPVANEIIPRITERMGKLTQVIADNKDVIKELGNDLASIWGGIETVVDKIGDGVGVIGGVIKDVYMAKANTEKSLIERYKNDTNVKTAEDILQRELSRRYTPQDRAAIEATPYLYEQELKKYEPVIKAIQDAREEIKKEKNVLSDEIASVAGISSAAADRRAVEENPELIKQAESLKKILQETSDIQYKLSHTDYENKKLDILQWQQDMLNQAEMTEDKRVAIEKLGAAKLAQIEHERADKLKEIRDNIAAADKTALQNKLDNIEKERQAWLKAGMDEAEATELAQKKIAKAYEEAQAKIKEHYQNAADIEYEMTHTAFEKQLRDIERWEELQKRKAESTEEAAAIGAEAIAKEARAFESEMDRIKGTLQSLEDKIFEQEHSQYENDLRRIEQERVRYFEEFQSKGILTPEWRAQIERWYQNAVGKLNQRASESRKSGSDYTKPPEGTMQSGGNGIMVIGADQIIDDGLIRGQQQQIGLLVDENRLRAQLAPKLSQEARDKIAAIQATKELTAAQKELLQKQQSAASGFQFIEGDKVTNLPIIDYPQITSEQFATPPNVLQEFAATMQETAANLDPLKEAANAQKAFADSTKAFPPEYFKNLADGAKAVSEMQGILTRSTMALIKEQDKLAKALSSLPTVNTGKNTDNQQTDGMLSLSTSTQEVRQAQNLLARTSRETALNLRDISDIPPQARIAQKDERLKFGFDMDAAGLAAGLASLGLMGATAPISAPVIGGVAVASLLAGLAKGSYDETTAAKEQYDARVNPLPPGVDLSVLETSLSTIDKNVQSVLQNMQGNTETSKDDRLQEIFGTLPNIEEYTKSILLELQSMNEVANATAVETPPAEMVDYLTPLKSIETNVQSILQQFKSLPALDANIPATETTVSFEIVVTPLNNIHSVLGNILTALTNQQPPQINVSPNNNINLGGAYVFDNAMKNQLVNDITSIIVDKITVAVQQGTSRSSYGYSA